MLCSATGTAEERLWELEGHARECHLRLAACYARRHLPMVTTCGEIAMRRYSCVVRLVVSGLPSMPRVMPPRSRHLSLDERGCCKPSEHQQPVPQRVACHLAKRNAVQARVAMCASGRSGLRL